MKRKLLPAIIAIACYPCLDATAISLSSLDGFSATSEGWKIGNLGVQPVRNAGNSFDGQPGFLTHFSDGGGANGKWLMWSDESDWLGNYTAAGVTGISFLADNQAGTALSLRIAFDGPGGWFFSGALTITDSTGGADWTPLSYTLSPGAFTHAGGSGGTGNFADTLSGVTRFEILGGAGAITYRSNGDIIDAGTSTNTVGIDTIAAVPEPTALGLLLGGSCLCAMIRRRR